MSKKFILCVSNFYRYDEKLVRELITQFLINPTTMVFFFGKITNNSPLFEIRKLFNDINFHLKKFQKRNKTNNQKDFLSCPISNNKNAYEGCLEILKIITKIKPDFNYRDVVTFLGKIAECQNSTTFISSLGSDVRRIIEKNLPANIDLISRVFNNIIDQDCSIKIIDNNFINNGHHFNIKDSLYPENNKIDYFSKNGVIETADEIFIILPLSFTEILKLKIKQKRKKIIIIDLCEYPVDKIIKKLKPTAIIRGALSRPFNDDFIGETPVYCLSPNTYRFIEF